MKHFQHLWDLKYKSHTTYLVTDSKSCNNFILLYMLPAPVALLPCSSAKCSGWQTKLCSSLSDCQPAPQTTWRLALSAAAEEVACWSPDAHGEGSQSVFQHIRSQISQALLVIKKGFIRILFASWWIMESTLWEVKNIVNICNAKKKVLLLKLKFKMKNC